jgi:iron complex transport system substrate-binding protein
VSWEEIAAAEPEVVVAIPCGLYADQAAAQAREHADRLRGLGARGVFALDAASSFSRPGPRLVDGVELLAHLLHDAPQPPPGVGFEPLWVSPETASAPRR